MSAHREAWSGKKPGILDPLWAESPLCPVSLRLHSRARRLPGLAARGESQSQARARGFSSDQGAEPQSYWSISRILQRRAGGKDPLSARSDFCHGLLAALGQALPWLLIAAVAMICGSCQPGAGAPESKHFSRSAEVSLGSEQELFDVDISELPSGFTFAAVLFGILALILLALIASTLSLLLGAKLAGIDGRTFGKALLSTILGFVASFPTGLVMGLIPIAGCALGPVASYLVSVVITVIIFRTTFAKASVAEIVHTVFNLAMIAAVLSMMAAMSDPDITFGSALRSLL